MSDDNRVIVEGNEKKSNYANLMYTKCTNITGINYVTNNNTNS